MSQNEYRIEVHESAAKEIRSLPSDVKARVISAITNLGDNPRPRGCVKLKGSNTLYRIRVGNYRVVYEVISSELMIMVTRVRHRREVYE